MADADQRRRMLAALLSIQTKQSPVVNALARAYAAPPPTNTMNRPSALANALNKPLPMEGRFGLLPLKDRNTLMGDERRDWALPGLLAGAWNAFTAPGRAMDGQAGFDPKAEAANFAGTFTGGGLLGSRMAPAPRGSIGMNAYHGSSHKFDSFDSSKVGSGEGSQAYGHGIYFAENPAVARAYTSAGGTASGNTKKYAADILAMYGDKTKALRHLEGILPPSGQKTFTGESRQFIESAIAAIKNNDLTPGNFYHVDVPDEAIGKMLDWDKPVSQQPNVLRAIRNQPWFKAMQARHRQTGQWYDDPMQKTGEGLYKYLQAGWSDDVAGGMSAQQASAALKTAGVPGMRYGLDENARNFVLFEDKLAKITKRE